MDYKEKYEEALARAKAGKPMDEVFPELAESESEDESIRKDIRLVVESSAMKYFKKTGQMPEWYDRIVAYLEKQKDEAQKQFNLGVQAGREEAMYEMEKEQQPAEWGEEDEKMFDRLKEILNIADAELCKKLNGEAFLIGEAEFNYLKFGIAHCLSWLELRIKSLRPQPHWKPSEEQMEAVLTAQSVGSYGHRKALAELYNDLKKL